MIDLFIQFEATYSSYNILLKANDPSIQMPPLSATYITSPNFLQITKQSSLDCPIQAKFQSSFDFRLLSDKQTTWLGEQDGKMQQSESFGVEVGGYLASLFIIYTFSQTIIMPLEDFQLKQSLGQGSFGCVCRCLRISDRQVYAMKQIKLQKLKQKDKKNALNEIRFLASIQTPFVVGYKEAFYDENSEMLCIVMEYANQGDLQGRIKKAIATKNRISEEQIWNVAYNVLQGLNKLHEANIIHRDIKPANIFFHQGLAKLGDLNVAKHLVDPFTSTQTGTPYYASPEVWNEQPYNFKSDVWSLGCVLYEMCMLKPPFRAESPDKLFKKIMVGEYEKVGSPYSKELTNFIAKLMTHGQKKRPEVKEILCYPKMLDMNEHFWNEEKVDQRLLKTIKFPENLRNLNQNLPKPKYLSKSKTSKLLQTQQSEMIITPKTTLKLPAPSLKLVTSEKSILVPPMEKIMKQLNLAKRSNQLSKNTSQKHIF